MADFFDYLRRERAASGDVAEEFGNLVGVLGAAVGQEEDGGLCEAAARQRTYPCSRNSTGRQGPADRASFVTPAQRLKAASMLAHLRHRSTDALIRTLTAL